MNSFSSASNKIFSFWDRDSSIPLLNPTCKYFLENVIHPHRSEWVQVFNSSIQRRKSHPSFSCNNKQLNFNSSLPYCSLEVQDMTFDYKFLRCAVKEMNARLLFAAKLAEGIRAELPERELYALWNCVTSVAPNNFLILFDVWKILEKNSSRSYEKDEKQFFIHPISLLRLFTSSTEKKRLTEESFGPVNGMNESEIVEQIFAQWA